MNESDGVSAAALRDALKDVEDVKATKRLMVAIAYERGVSQTELAEWYGLSRKTVYNWLRRVEGNPLPEAVSDNGRSGRPPKLDSEQRAEVRGILEGSPDIVGYDADEWSIPLVRRLVDDRFGVTYSRTSAHRLLSNNG